MSFKTTAVITSVVTLLLAVGWIFFGNLLLLQWDILPEENALLIGRRMGVLFLGLSIIFFFSRSIPASAARTTLSTAASTVCLLLVLLGIYELSAGRVGNSIIFSILLELFLGSAYILVILKDMRSVKNISSAISDGV